MRKTIEDFKILQIGVNYIFESRRFGEGHYGSTAQPIVGINKY